MKFSLYIAKRYLFTKSSNNAINIITIIAATGVIVGAMSLFIVLSGFSGLKEFSLQFTSIFDSDLKVFPQAGKTISFTAAQKKALKKVDGITAFSEIIEERVFMQYKGKSQLAYIKGIDTNYGNVNPIDSILYFGDWLIEDEFETVIGLSTAARLGLSPRDYGNLLQLNVPKPGTGQVLDPTKAFNSEGVVVAGVYEVNEDINDKYIFTDIRFARNLLQLDSTKVSAIEIKLKDLDSETETRVAIESILGNKILIKNRIQQNDALYKMLNTENVAVYLIFTLVLIIALFNVVGSIIMMVLDKRKSITTLYNMGATIKEIRKIFFLQGTLMSLLGGALGIGLGVVVVLAQLQFKLIYITAELPYPVVFSFLNVLVVFATISVLGIAASKIAANRVNEKLMA